MNCAGFSLGWRLQVRRRLSLIVFAVGLSLPALLINFAFTADYLSRASDAQYVAAVLGPLGQGTIKPVQTLNGSSHQEFLSALRKRDEKLKRIAPSSTLVVHVRESAIGFGERQAAASATGDDWEPAHFDRTAFRSSSGHMPTSDDTVALSSALVEELGVSLGDTVLYGGKSFEVVGVAERALDLNRAEAFFSTEGILRATREIFDYSWRYSDPADNQKLMEWNLTAPAGEAIIVETRFDIENRLRSYGQRLPLPLVAGALAVLACAALLLRTFTRDEQSDRSERLTRLGGSKVSRLAVGLGGASAIAVLSAGVAVLGSTLLIFSLRQSVWRAGLRIPGEVEIPFLPCISAWLIGCSVLAIGMTVPYRARRVVKPLASDGQSGYRALLSLGRLRAHFSERRWSRIGTTCALLVSFALIIFTDTAIAATNSRPTDLAAGQFRILRGGLSDFSDSDTAVNQRPDELMSALAKRLPGQFYAVSELVVDTRLKDSSKIEQRLDVSLPGHSGFAFVGAEQAAAALIGRPMSVLERQAYAAGKVILFKSDVGAAPDAAIVTAYSAERARRVGSVEVFTDLSAPLVPAVMTNVIVGPAGLRHEPFDALKARPEVAYVLSAPGAIGDVVDKQYLNSTLAQFGVPASAVVMTEPLSERSDGIVSLLVLTVFAGLAIAVLELASQAVDTREDQAKLRRLNGSWIFRYRFVYMPVLQRQVLTVVLPLLVATLIANFSIGSYGITPSINAAAVIAALCVTALLTASLLMFWKVK